METVVPAVKHGSAGKRRKILVRLRSIAGHVGGIERMVVEDAYCIDVIRQVQAVQRALDKVNSMLLEDHLEHCATTAIRSSNARVRERTIAELLEVFKTSSRVRPAGAGRARRH